MNAPSAFQRAFEDAQTLLARFSRDEQVLSALDQAAKAIADCFQAGGKVLACGNGGSLCDAMHFAEEFTGRFHRDRKPYPAFALSDPTHMSCVGNDYGFEFVYARMVEAFARPGDILLILSTSGNSPNLVEAAEAAHRNGARVFGWLGRGGGKVGPLCDLMIVAPGETSDRIQELHMLSLHALIETVEKILGHS